MTEEHPMECSSVETGVTEWFTGHCPLHCSTSRGVPSILLASELQRHGIKPVSANNFTFFYSVTVHF